MDRPAAATRADSPVRRTYVLDTSVLLADPDSLLRFDEHDVVIPLVVIEELDRQKTRPDEVGANARAVIRLLDSLGASTRDVTKSLRLPSGGHLRVEVNKITHPSFPEVLDPTTADHRLLACCLNLADAGGEVVLVTRDTSLRIKAASIGVTVEDYRADQIRSSDLPASPRVVEVDVETVDLLHRNRRATLPVTPRAAREYFIVKSGSASALAKRSSAESDGSSVEVQLLDRDALASVTKPRGAAQAAALDLLLDPEVQAVALLGPAGTGKTYLALAAAIHQTMHSSLYRRVSVYRPIMPVGGQELGFLPGELDEKLAPWMSAVYDTAAAILRGEDSPSDTVDGWVEAGLLELAPVTFLRGRTLTGEFVIVDEAQNLERSTLKTILTRAGEGTKVVLCGDTAQIDNPYVSAHTGLAAVCELLASSPLFGAVTLDRTVRSDLAALAASVL